MALLAIETGMRAGELSALKWSDIDWFKNQIHIHAQLLGDRKSGTTVYYYVDYTKNERGQSKGGRYYPITGEIDKLLLKLRTKQKENNIKSDFVFCDSNGEWITVKGYESFLSKLIKKLNLNGSNHTFRRTLNSKMITMGISVADRAKLLGHQIETNLSCYSYAQKEYCENARALLNGIDNHGVHFLGNGVHSQKQIV